MIATAYSTGRPSRALPLSATLPAAAAIGFVVGGLTSFAQTVLPDWIGSVANSSSGWTLVTVLVVALLGARPAAAAVLGPACFVALTLGYTVVSTMRGFPTSEEFFLVAGVVVGPFIGVATAWLRERGVHAALGAGLLAGIGVGEGAFGLTRLLGTTSPVYWSLAALGGVALVAVVCVRSLDRWSHRGLAVLTTAGVAGAFLLAFALLG